MKNLNLLVIVLFLLSACSTSLDNRETSYLKSHNGKKLQAPAPLKTASISQFYDLPDPPKNPQVSIAPPSDKDANKQLS